SSISASSSSRKNRSTSRPLTRATSASCAMRPSRSCATSRTVVPRGYSRTVPSGRRTVTLLTTCPSAIASTLLPHTSSKRNGLPSPRGTRVRLSRFHPAWRRALERGRPPRAAITVPTGPAYWGAWHPLGGRLGGGFPELRRPVLTASGTGSLGGGGCSVLVLRIAFRAGRNDCPRLGLASPPL